MKARIIDLRYRMSDVLKALERNEDVIIQHRGKTKGILTTPVPATGGSVEEHPFFGMRRGETSVEAEMDVLRGGRHRAL